jgi:hypothetical protein
MEQRKKNTNTNKKNNNKKTRRKGCTKAWLKPCLALGTCDRSHVLRWASVAQPPAPVPLTHTASLGSVPFNACSLLASPVSWGTHYNLGITFTASGMARLGVHTGKPSLLHGFIEIGANPHLTAHSFPLLHFACLQNHDHVDNNRFTDSSRCCLNPLDHSCRLSILVLVLSTLPMNLGKHFPGCCMPARYSEMFFQTK